MNILSYLQADGRTQTHTHARCKTDGQTENITPPPPSVNTRLVCTHEECEVDDDERCSGTD